MCTKDQALAILGDAHAQCSAVFDGCIKDAYLYGSFARGDFDAESDVDILLTVDADARTISGRRSAVASVSSRLSLEYGVTVSITAKPLEQFLQYADTLPFYKNVIGEGVRYAG